MLKLFFMILWSLMCVAGTLIPEFAMYFSWNLIQPESELARVLMVVLFWFAGAGLCIVFGIIGFILWVTGIAAIADAR